MTAKDAINKLTPCDVAVETKQEDLKGMLSAADGMKITSSKIC